MKFLKVLLDFSFIKLMNRDKKLKNALIYYFENNEDKDLQKLFTKNFSYPSDMVEDPVRYNKETGQIYFVINFNSKELFFNEATIQAAFTQSLSILQENLPLGVTQYLEPRIEGRIEESFSLLITLNPIESATNKEILIFFSKKLGFLISVILLIIIIANVI